MTQIEAKHLLYLLNYVEEMFEFSDISIETNIDLQHSIDKLSAILAAREALGKEDNRDV
jgi:hypothetical protein